MIQKIESEVSDAMESLWEDLRELPTRIFTEQQMQAFTSKMEAMWGNGLGKSHYFERGVGIIANWASNTKKLQLDHAPMITLLVNVLRVEAG